MDIKNEDDLRKSLGIDSWRNLSKDKLLAFVSEMPNMSKEVALKAIEQFPDFRSLVVDSLTQVQAQAAHAVDVNWKSQKKVHKALADYRKALERELDRENLTTEDRFAILGLFQKAIDQESAKDSEHKAFVFGIIGTVAKVAAVGLVAAVAVLGVSTKLSDDSAS
jgi:hypothetical protein